MGKVEIKLQVNGEPRQMKTETHWTLLQVLRDELGLMGTKEGCGNGECGACTVIMNDKAVPSCLVPAIRAEGKKITTIEGLGDGKLNRIQEAFVEQGAVQCGFCTPGIVMSAAVFLKENPQPSEDEVREALKGNLCRCTGYAKHVKALMSITGLGGN
jgi:carbon-monoxide dehydrogenase small subunit